MRYLLILHSVTLFLLPFYIVRFSFYSIPFTLLEILVVLSIVSSLGYMYYQKISFSYLKTFFDLPLLFLFISAVLSLFVTPDVQGGLGIFKAYFFEPILFFYSLVFVGRKSKKYSFILWSLLGAVLIVSIIGLIQKLTGQFIFAEHEFLKDRVTAVYNSANSLALFIGPLIPIVAALFFGVKRKVYKVGLLFLLGFMSLIMLWTQSRGGILAEVFTLGVVLYGLLSFKSKTLKKFWLLIPTFFIIFSIAFFVQVYQVYNPTVHSTDGRIEDDTLQIRYATWFSTTQILSHNIILGTGLNGFKQTYNNYKLDQFSEEYQYPHTIVFNFWTETGLLGLVSFTFLLSYIFYVLIHLNKKNRHYISIGLIGAFACVVIHGLVDVPYFKNDLSVQFWALVAVVQLLKDTKEYI